MGMRAAFSIARSLEFNSIGTSARVCFSTQVVSSSPADSAKKKLKAVSRVSKIGPTGKLPPQTLYLIEIGLELDQIKKIAHRYPNFSYFNLEGKIKPIVKFLLHLGVPESKIPSILVRCPLLCGLRLSENIIPAMTFLEGLGVDKTQWSKVIHRAPALFSHSRQKFQSTADFLTEMGVSKQNIGKILTRWPTITYVSIEDKLRPTAEYFRSLGIDNAILLRQCPMTFGLNIESNLKPITQFFLDKGFTIQEIGTMVSKFGCLYAFGLVQNLIPKWEFFLTMDYPRSDLIKVPNYFGYSLEKRIKPRFALVKKHGVQMRLATWLAAPQSVFEKAVMKKMHSKGMMCSKS